MRECVGLSFQANICGGQFKSGAPVHFLDGVIRSHDLMDHEIGEDDAREHMFGHGADAVCLIHDFPLRAGVDNRTITDGGRFTKPVPGGGA